MKKLYGDAPRTVTGGWTMPQDGDVLYQSEGNFGISDFFSYRFKAFFVSRKATGRLTGNSFTASGIYTELSISYDVEDAPDGKQRRSFICHFDPTFLLHPFFELGK